MINPVGRLVLLQRTPRDKLVQAISFLGIPIVLGPVLGPVVGGFIVTYFTWQWIFLINIPIGLCAYLLSRTTLRDVPGQAAYPLDWRGLLLSGCGLASMIFGASHLGGPDREFGTTALPIALGLVSLALYAVYSKKAAYPILDLTLLRTPSFRNAIVGGIALRVAVGAMPLLLALMLQIGFGLNPLHSGLITFTSAAAALVMKMTAGPILARFGFKRVLSINTLCLAVMLRPLRGDQAHDLAGRDRRHSAGRRLFPVAAVHRVEHPDLRRRPRRGPKPGERTVQRDPAVRRDAERQPGRHVVGAHAELHRTPYDPGRRCDPVVRPACGFKPRPRCPLFFRMSSADGGEISGRT